jgi:hypothetical protein
LIPEQLQEYELIRVCRPDCESHRNCNSEGKRPVTSVEDREKAHGIKKWLLEGGNYGVPAHSGNDLVIFDVDSVGFERVVTEELPKDTFTVRSGGEGFGKHLYYRCREFKRNADYKDPEGSVRSNNYHAVGPNSDHVSGGRYEVMKDRPIREVSLTDLQTVLNRLDEKDDRENVKTAAARAAPSFYTNKDKEVLSFVRRDDRREELRNVLLSPNPSHGERVWLVGFLHGACGLSENEIMDLLIGNSPWATDKDITRKHVEGVCSQTQRGTHYSNYSSDDASFKEGEGAEGNHPSGGKSMSFEYDQIKSFHVYDGDGQEDVEDGDRVVKVELTSMEGVGDDGEQVDTEFVSISKGKFQDDGEFGVSPNYPGDSKSIGNANPEDLRLIAEGLEELAEELE